MTLSMEGTFFENCSCDAFCPCTGSNMARRATGDSCRARAGASHGFFCPGCCWALMVVMVGLGVVDVPAMVGLAVVIAPEKMWRHGERFARLLGVVALVWAAAIAVSPRLAPALDPAANMADMQLRTGDEPRTTGAGRERAVPAT